MGVPVVSILEDDDLWVSLNVGETNTLLFIKVKPLKDSYLLLIRM